MTFKKSIRKYGSYVWHLPNVQKFVSDKLYVSIQYNNFFKKKLDLNSPKTFNEKIQWLKLNDRNPIYSDLVDKYKVRKYISDKVGESYLIPLLGVFKNYEEIDFNLLPNSFVLKPNHTSGDIFICRNKEEIDHEKLKKSVNKWLNKNYFWTHREWPYKHIEPRILCEMYMEDNFDSDLRDYKFMCFNGEVKCSFVGLNRNSEQGLNVDFYDLNWEKMPFERHYPKSNENIVKPLNYLKMLDIAKELSRDLTFVRVDFYEINGKLYFGELTFYPGSGLEEFNPESYDYLLGSWLRLPFE